MPRSAMQRYAVQSNNCSMDSYSGLKGSPVRTGRLYVRNSALISVATTQTKHTTQLDIGILSAKQTAFHQSEAQMKRQSIAAAFNVVFTLSHL